MKLKRRTFLAALPLALASTAQPNAALASKSRRTATMPLNGLGKIRLGPPAIWSERASLKLSILSRLGAHGTYVLSLKAKTPAVLPADVRFGLTFGAVPGFKQGVAFWRYAPWKSWTKPMAMTSAGDLQADDVQCAYWQYDDGTYAVALPLGGGGFRTTLGTQKPNGTSSQLASVCSAVGPAIGARIMPQLAIGFGTDLFVTMANVFDDAMTALGTPENLRKHKRLPDALTNLGWNTWNASNLGKDLSAAWVLDQVGKIRATGAPIRTVVLDDGHFQAKDNQLQSQTPDRTKFPDGFQPVVAALQRDQGIKHVGLWHAFNAYWNGIDPSSELGRSLSGKLFTWTQASSPTDTSGKRVTYSFLRPEPKLLDAYFDAYHFDLKSAGFSLIKVDNQLVAERMAKDNYPIWDLAKALHGAINSGALKHFDNAMINCMDMTNDAFLNFGTSAVARSVEDYFPYKTTETYDLQEGNAAAHVLQAMYNALYFGEMVYPDFDMFESTNPNADLHAFVRAANCAPIYVTDKAGEHNVGLLKSLVDADGVTLRSDTPLRPTKDCLFQIQSPVLFKASSRVRDGAILLLANLADSDEVAGIARLSDITGLAKGDYIAVARQGKPRRMGWDEAMPYRLKRFGHDLVLVAPIKAGRAVLGLRDKLNGLASVRDVVHDKTLQLTVRDAGTLVVWCEVRPDAVTVDGQPWPYAFENNVLELILAAGSRSYVITIT